MKPPAYYQGGKGRIAPEILRVIAPHGARSLPGLVDLCCGSGGLFLRAVADGLDPSLVVAVDSGPWGDFWAAIGSGRFPLDRLEWYCSYYRPETWAACLDEIATEPDLAAFVLCQAGAYGGHPVLWGPGWKRRKRKFREGDPRYRSSEPAPDQWVSTKGVLINRADPARHGVSIPKPAPAPGNWRPPCANPDGPEQRSPSRPSGSSILDRVRWAVEHCAGIRAFRAELVLTAHGVTVRGVGAPAKAALEQFGLRYIDPPYGGTAGYGTAALDWSAVARALGGAWISEARALSSHAVRLSANKRSMVGGAAQSARAPREEWLSWVF